MDRNLSLIQLISSVAVFPLNLLKTKSDLDKINNFGVSLEKYLRIEKKFRRIQIKNK